MFVVKYFVVLIFVLYAWAPAFFERFFFFNEIICLYGILVFWKHKAYFLSDLIVRAAIPFLCVFWVVWVASFFVQENAVVYVRRLSVFYSFFALFTAFHMVSVMKDSNVKWLWLFAVQKVNMVFGYMFLSASVATTRAGFWLASFLLVSAYTMIFGGGTAIIALSLSFLILNLNRLLFVVFCLIVSFVFVAFLDVNWVYGYNTYLVDIYEYLDVYDFLALDGNMAVRLFMWWEVVSHLIPQSYGFGVGFGTVLFKEEFIYFLGLRNQLIADEYLEYTLSPHNSFVYILASMGIPGVLSFMFMYYKIWVDHKKRALLGILGEMEYRAFAIFMAYSIAAGLNVVIESPIHSGLYWGALGIYVWARACANEKDLV